MTPTSGGGSLACGGVPINTVTGPTALRRCSLTAIHALVGGGLGATASGVRCWRYPSATSRLFTPALPPASTSAVRIFPVSLGGNEAVVAALTRLVTRSSENVRTNTRETTKETGGRTARALKFSTKGRQLNRIASADSSTTARTK